MKSKIDCLLKLLFQKKRTLVIILVTFLLLLVGCQFNKELSSVEMNENTASVHFISTGNSDCILIKAKGSTILIDAGDNDDEVNIVNYLKDEGVEKIDYLINTHPDADHCGGLDAVVNNFQISNVFVGNGDASTKTYRDFILALADKGLTPSVPLESVKFSLGEEQFMEFYNTATVWDNANDSSIVTKFVDQENSFLFMGDASKDVEKTLLNELNQIDVLKIGHHGSKTATSEAFINIVKPSYAIIECGLNNKYGHPNEQVLSLLEKSNCKVYRTDQDGNIIINSDGKNIEINVEDKK